MSILPDTTSASDFIQTSLHLLAAECAEAYTALCLQMSGRPLELWIGSEGMLLDFQADLADVLPLPDGSRFELRLLTDWQTVLDMADAKLTIYTAVLSGRLELFGGVNELSRLYAALQTYLRGAVRCVSFPNLLDEVRKTHTAAQS